MVLAGIGALTGVPTLLVGVLKAYIPLLAIGSACSGAGIAFLWLAWLDRFAALSYKNIIRYTILSTLLMIAFNLVGDISPSTGSTAEVLIVLSPIAAFVFLLRDWGTTGLWPNEQPDSTETAALSTKSFLGFCAVMLLFPFAYHASIASLSPATSLLERSGGDIVSLILFTLILKATNGKVGLAMVYRVAMPLVLGGFLLCFVLPTQTTALNALITGSGYKFATLFLIVMLLRMAPSSSIRWVVLGGALAAKFLGNALARWIEFDPSAGLLSSGNVTVAVAVVAILVCVILWTFPSATELQGNEASSSESKTLETICKNISEGYKLTPRESEVLLLLAQGRNQASIAEILFIGKGTAHTHILHVYQKLGIHNQQELIEFVHSK